MNIDQDADGRISDRDIDITERLTKIQKDTTQVRLVWVAMIGMCVVTLILFAPWIPDSRIIALDNILDLYYVTQASVIGMYMGVKAYLGRKGH